ncbi:MAG: (d)CMP kinase [Chloroflexi bacterium]|nr:MAG: (d)CMP kinase [Chloroflexota bacterium]MBL1197338.1 (d)CMP kinase [Chloroflexota bacterium]NOH14635.1 (d)CMP kinase [Chloroflexota bacterium]
MSKTMTIAIDGPAASGKSTLAKNLAEDLGYLYFDTGVMYRAITLVALERGIDVEDEEACTALAESVRIDIEPPSEERRLYDVLIDGDDKTWEIRESDVDANVSVVAACPGVRHALTRQQRRIGLSGDVVMVGRDIGTVVMPDADIKLYLDASVEERARRRFIDMLAQGEEVELEDVLASMRMRDQLDSGRDVAPLKPADDAIVLDSDKKSEEEVLEEVKRLVEENQVEPS